MRPVITSHEDDHIGLAVIRSLGRNAIDFQVVSKTKNSLGYQSRYSKNKVISTYNLDFFSRLSPDDVVYPMYEDTMLFLAKNAQKLQCRLGFPDYETIKAASDKSLLIKHAMEHNIPCPKTFFITKPEDLRDCIPEISFPVVLKPKWGDGGKGIRFMDSTDELNKNAAGYLAKNGPFLLQEKIPFTTKFTVGTLSNADHELRRACVIRELRNYPIETGQACFVETVEDQNLVSLSEKLLKSLNFTGIADIDFVIDERDNKPKLMEVNSRFWGSVQVAINAGCDFPVLLHRMLQDGDIARSFSYKTGVRCRYVLFNDLARVLTILRRAVPLKVKQKAVLDFLRFHEDEGYYVYSLDDLVPVFGLAYIKILRKMPFVTKGSW